MELDDKYRDPTNSVILLKSNLAMPSGRRISAADFYDRMIYDGVRKGDPAAVREFLRQVEANDRALAADYAEDRRNDHPNRPVVIKPPKLRPLAEALLILEIACLDCESAGALAPPGSGSGDTVPVRFHIHDWALACASVRPGSHATFDEDRAAVQCLAGSAWVEPDEQGGHAEARQASLALFRRLYPPEGKRFAKGVCPNPEGRPRGSRKKRSAVPFPWLQEKMEQRDLNGPIRKRPRAAVMLLKLAELASGDAKLQALLLPFIRRTRLTHWSSIPLPTIVEIIRR